MLSMVNGAGVGEDADQRHIIERHGIAGSAVLAGNGGRQGAAAVDGGVLDLA